MKKHLLIFYISLLSILPGLRAMATGVIGGTPTTTGPATNFIISAYNIMGSGSTLPPNPDANGIMYVKKGSSGDGSSWANAMGEVADALKAAKTNTTIKQIWVAAGTYLPKYSPEDGATFGTDQGRDNAFLLVKNVKLYGGFAGTEAAITNRVANTNTTTLSGDFNGDDVATGLGYTLSITNNTENAYHVIIAVGTVGTALLDGFTIKGGNGNGSGGITVNGSGVNRGLCGGVFICASSPTLSNLTISGNDCYGSGAMFIMLSSSPALTNVTIIGNSGGGISNSSSSPILTNVSIIGNTNGGVYNISSSPILTNVTISGNVADGNGAGSQLFYNAGSTITVKNSIIFGPEIGAVFDSGGTLNASYSLIKSINSTDNHNVSASGLTIYDIFNDPNTGDYTLKAGSPMIDKGSNALFAGLNTATKDLAGNARVTNYSTGGVIDMGAYEYQGGGSQTITFNTLPSKTFGDANFTLNASSTNSNVPITFASSNPAVATVNGNTATVVGAGTATITASQAADATHLAAADVPQLLTVNKAGQTITFATLLPKTFGGADFTLNATSTNPAIPVTFTSSNTAVATINGNTVTIVSAGTTTITASQAADANHLAATDVPRLLTVNKAGQTITFNTLPSKTFGDADFTLTATSTNTAIPVTFTSSNPAVATVTGNTVHIVSSGTTMITASQVGDDNYNAATDVQRTLNVGPAGASVITFAALPSKTYGDADFTITASSTNTAVPVTFISSNTAVATVSGNTVTIVGAGTTTITASQASDANHSAAIDVPQLLTVNKAGQTITFNTLPSKTFGDAAFSVNATSTNNAIPINFTSSNPAVATINGNVVTIAGAGTTTIIASQAGDDNHNAATDVQRVLNVGQASATVITFVALPAKTFGDADFTLSASSTNPATPVTFISSNTAVATVTGSTVTIIGAGTTTITASQTGDANHPAAADAPQLLTVSKADQEITFAALPSKIFGDADFTLSVSSTNPATPVTFTSSDNAVATVTGNTVHIVSSGITTITASQADDANHNAATAIQRTLNIGQAGAPVITFAVLPAKTFGDADFTLSANSTNPAVPVTFASSNIAVATMNGSTVTIIGAGTTTITASQTADANHQAAADVPQLLTVNKAGQTITFNAPPPKTFGEADFTLSANSTNGNIPVTFTSSNTTVATVNGNIVHIVSAGTTTITASQTGDANHNAATDVQRTLNVGQAGAPVITFAVLPAKTFGDADFTLSASSTNPAEPVTFASSNIAVATVNGNTVTIVGAGTTTIIASQTADANHQAAANVPQLLTVNKAGQTIAFNALSSKIFGDADFTISATSNNNAIPVTFTTSNNAVATVSGNTIHIVSAGTTTITASQTGDANHNAATDVQRTLNVGQAGAPVITFASLPVKTFGDMDFTVTANSTNPAVPVTFTSSNTAVATMNGNTVTIVGAGTTTITANQAADVNHPAATSIPQLLTVNKAGQTITFNALPPKTFGDVDFTISATSTNNTIPVTFTSSNNAVATVAGNTIHIVSAGATVITASQAGDANHDAAIDVQRTLNVSQAGAPVITFAALPSKTFGDVDFTISATSTNPTTPLTFASSNTAVATVNGNTITVVGAGTTTITASQAGDVNHPAATDVPQLLTVNKADQVITFAVLPSKIFGDADFTLSTSSTNPAIPVTFVSSNLTVATLSGNTVTIVGAGTTKITASQPGDANHNAATDVQRTLNVSLAGAPVITFAALPAKTFGDADFTISANTTNPTTPVTFASSNTAVATISGNTIHIISAGTTTITAAQAGDANHQAAADVPQLLTVNKTGQTITFNALSPKTFGDVDFTISATSTNNAIPVTFTSSNPAVATVAGNTVHIVSSGITTITASQAGDADHNAATAVQRILNVGQAGAPVITFAALPIKTFGDADFNISASSTNPTVPVIFTSSNTAVATVNGNTITIVGAGTTTITASQAGNNNYSAAADVPKTLTVNPKAITVTADARSKTYGDADPALTYQITNGALVGTDVFTGTLNRETGGNAGTYAIKQGTLALSTNYTLTYTGAQLSINKKVLTVTADNKIKVYGAANPALTITYSGFADTEDAGSLTTVASAATIATASSPVNTYPIIPAGAVSNNYSFNYVPGTLKVTPAVLTITADAKTKTFGTANPPLTASYIGFVNGDNSASLNTPPTLTTTAIINSPAGDYPITAKDAVADNYSITYLPGTLKVNGAVLTITVDNKSKVYGAANPTLTASYSGFVNGDTEASLTTRPALNTTATAGSAVNTYAITAGGAVIPNYTIVYVPGTLTVNKAPLTVTAENKSRNYGMANPVLTVAYNGFVNGDDATKLGTAPTATTTTTATTLPGSYDITVNGGISANYNFSYLNGKLTIIPLTNANLNNLAISTGTLAPGFATDIFDYRVSVENAVSSVRLTPTFDPTATARVNGSNTTNGHPSSAQSLNVGDNIIKLVVTAQDGVTKNTYTLNVYRSISPKNISATNILTPNGDGKNDYWVIEDILLYPDNNVSVYDKAGRVVYNKHGYTNDWDGSLKGAPLNEGTYYYNVSLGQGLPSFKGYITLLRSH